MYWEDKIIPNKDNNLTAWIEMNNRPQGLFFFFEITKGDAFGLLELLTSKKTDNTREESSWKYRDLIPSQVLVPRGQQGEQEDTVQVKRRRWGHAGAILGSTQWQARKYNQAQFPCWGRMPTEVKGCFVYLAGFVRTTLLVPTGRPLAPLSSHSPKPGPMSCSCHSRIIWHDTTQTPLPSQISRNTRSQTLTTPLSPPSSFCGAHLVLLRHDCHTTLEETIWAQSGCSLSPSLSLRLWAGTLDSVSNTCVCYLQISFPPASGPGA